MGLLDVHYPGSSSLLEGSPYDSVQWDPIRRTTYGNYPRVAYADPRGAEAPRSNAAMNYGYAPPAPTSYPNNAAAWAAQAGAGAPGTGPNPFYTVANVKSPELDAPVKGLFEQFNTLRGMDPTADFKAAYDASIPGFNAATKEENAAAGDYYNGNVQGRLDTLRSQRKQAVGLASDRALAGLKRLLSTERMGSSGSAPIGASSYISKLGLDKSADIYAKAAMDDAEQSRTDLGFVEQMKQALRGERSKALLGELQRTLLPSQVTGQWFNTLVGALNPLAQLQLGNTFYGLGKQRGDVRTGAPTFNPGFA